MGNEAATRFRQLANRCVPSGDHGTDMSAYENYTAVSADYDRTRIPVGVEIILGCLASGGRSLGSLRLLDAGCGTGSYCAALRPYAGAIDAVDLNPSMLGVARAKLEGTPDVRSPCSGRHRRAAVRGRLLRRGDGEPGAPPSRGLAAPTVGRCSAGCSANSRGCCAPVAWRSSTPAPTSSSGVAGGTPRSFRKRSRQFAGATPTGRC